MSQLSSDVPALCVLLRLLSFFGFAALPSCKQLEYLQLIPHGSKLCGSLGLVFGAAGWGWFIPRQVFVPKTHLGDELWQFSLNSTIHTLALCARAHTVLPIKLLLPWFLSSWE